MIESFTIISGIIALISILNNWDIKRKKSFFWAFIFILIIFDGLRWQMGTDWFSYYNYFQIANNYFSPRFEPGFMLYTRLIRSFTENYSVYLLITTSAIYIGIFYTVFKITKFSLLSLFFLTGTIPWYSGSLRQLMASIFFTIALKAVIERKLKYYIILMLLGITFHVTNLAFLPMYWLYGMTTSMFLTIFVSLFAILSLMELKYSYFDILIHIFDPGKSIENRIGGTLAESHPAFGLLRKVLTLIGYIYFWNRSKLFSNKDKPDQAKVKFFLYMTSFSVAFYIIGTYYISLFSSRLDIYTGIICASVLTGLLETSFKSKQTRVLLFVFVLILVIIFYSRLQMMDLFHPYSSIFYNINYHRALY